MNQSFFLRTFCHSALAFLEPKIYIVEEHFGRKIFRCSAGVLFLRSFKTQEFLQIVESMKSMNSFKKNRTRNPKTAKRNERVPSFALVLRSPI